LLRKSGEIALPLNKTTRRHAARHSGHVGQFSPRKGPSLEQAAKKLIDFFDKSLLQHFGFERFLIVQTIPFERKAL